LKAQYVAKTFDDDLMLPERIAAMCADLFQRLCANGGPEQKVIIFCNRDLHADRVAAQMQNLYALVQARQGRTPKEHYAFKCTAEGGAELMSPCVARRALLHRLHRRPAGHRRGHRAAQRGGVLPLPGIGILFYQMVGRGTRIHERTQQVQVLALRLHRRHRPVRHRLHHRANAPKKTRRWRQGRAAAMTAAAAMMAVATMPAAAA
jgi:type I restriction enzyme R subunit